MSRQTSWLYFLILVVCATTLWAACAGTPTSQAPSTTGLLIQAGFQVRQADNPQKLAHLKKLFNNRFVHVHFGDQSVLAYPDHDSQRLYVGNEAAYKRYQGLAAQHGSAEAQQAAPQQAPSTFDWDMWEISQGAGP